ncbi:MAG: phosphoglycerate kinase [Chloroflexota bacterium]|nr:phosphoglycerate kinase [Chloroflexota bacterium]
MKKKTVKDIEVAGKHVLMRVDFNVPLAEGRVTDDTRLRAALPTIRYLVDKEAKVILMSHLGRPPGKVVDELRMDPVAERLSELLGRPVGKLDDCIGDEVKAAVAEMRPGDVILLENTRFHPEERKNDPEFAKKLAELADVFVNDAFGTAHRAHASTVGLAQYLPAVAGLLMEKEVDTLGRVLESPEHPFVAILGGAKISDKIGVIESFLSRADLLLIGGGMANTFFKAQGYEVGDSLVEDESLGVARELLEKAGGKLILPVDAVVADEFSADAKSKVLSVGKVPEGWRILDIGPETVALFEKKLAGAKMVVWNGPMGVFEFPKFAAGTKAIARFLAELEAITIIGGGDVVAAVRQAGVAEEMTHVSTGGGAALKFLEGKELPAIAILEER